MQTRNISILALIVLLLGAGGWWFWHSSAPSSKNNRSSNKKESLTERLMPAISVANVNVTDIEEGKIKLTSKVTLTNPLPVDINTNRLSYEIYIDSVRVIQDAYGKPIHIASSKSTEIDLPVEVLEKPMAKVLKYFDERKIDSADYTMKATFLVNVPVAGEKNFTMHISKRLPALRVPKIKIKKTDLHLLKMKKKGVDMIVQVTNPNLFPLKMKDARYTVAIENGLNMAGALQKVVNLPARGTKDVSMHADIKEGKVLKTGLKFLFNQDDTHFKSTFHCKLLSDNKILNNSNMAFNMQGTVAELMNAAKGAK